MNLVRHPLHSTMAERGALSSSRCEWSCCRENGNESCQGSFFFGVKVHISSLFTRGCDVEICYVGLLRASAKSANTSKYKYGLRYVPAISMPGRSAEVNCVELRYNCMTGMPGHKGKDRRREGTRPLPRDLLPDMTALCSFIL